MCGADASDGLPRKKKSTNTSKEKMTRRNGRVGWDVGEALEERGPAESPIDSTTGRVGKGTGSGEQRVTPLGRSLTIYVREGKTRGKRESRVGREIVGIIEGRGSRDRPAVVVERQELAVNRTVRSVW